MADKSKNESNDRPGTALNPDAPAANQESTIRDAKHPAEKPDPSTVAQVEEVKDPVRG
jgi:hypothetical protein